MGLTFGQTEFGNAELGDQRRSERLVRMADAAMARPEAGLPKMMGSDAELEGTYRFLNHPHIEPEQVLAPHVRRTVERCRSHEVIWVAHDTTSLVFGGETEREGLGRVKNKKQGFDAHVTIAVEPGESHQMLGVLEIQRINSVGKKPRGRSGRPHRAPAEPSRWEQGVQSASRHVGVAGPELVHLMDREADSYGLWASMVKRGQRFVIRVHHDRRLKSSRKLFERLDELSEQPATLVREVPLSRRGKEGGSTLRKIHPSRPARLATLEVRACSLTIPRTDYRYADDDPEQLTLNVVHVREPNPPEGHQAVDWKLITTEPIETPEQVAEIIDAYRGRWTIEEFFKALKSGCAIEKRQLESYDALAMMLALLAPVAWRLLQLRSLADSVPDLPADRVLTDLQLKVLRAKARDPFPDSPTVADALFAVARLGGFLKHNKRPGWQVLGRGFHDLLLMEAGWASALAEMSCDQ